MPISMLKTYILTTNIHSIFYFFQSFSCPKNALKPQKKNNQQKQPKQKKQNTTLPPPKKKKKKQRHGRSGASSQDAPKRCPARASASVTASSMSCSKRRRRSGTGWSFLFAFNGVLTVFIKKKNKCEVLRKFVFFFFNDVNYI